MLLPDVQVLFAFLLTMPFAAGFGRVSTLQKDVFFGTLVCTAVLDGVAHGAVGAPPAVVAPARQGAQAQGGLAPEVRLAPKIGVLQSMLTSR